MKELMTLAAVLVCSVSLTDAYPLDNGLARTPPMGWNSWNKFGCDVNEQLIREMADAIVTSGMKDAGYVYLVINDCWQVDRDAQGNILPDPQRRGMGQTTSGRWTSGRAVQSWSQEPRDLGVVD